PWRDVATAAHGNGYPAVCSGTARLRGRGEEARAGAGSGAGAFSGYRGASLAGTCATAGAESAPPPLRLAAGADSGQQRLFDPKGAGKIRLRRAEFQSRPYGSRAEGF